MNNIDNSDIRRTIDRFLAGETSLGEERALYDFFRRSDLPVGLAAYREMFQWYASLAEAGKEEAKVSAEAAPAPRPVSGSGSKARLLRMRPMQWISAAAVIALLFTIGFVLRTPSTSVPEEYLSYEGSYIIRDGKKITDLSVVVPEIQRAEQMVNERLSALDARIEAADAAFDRSVTSAYDLSDPAVREIVEASFSY